MGFFKTLITGYKIMFQDISTKHNDLFPRLFTGTGTGLMMIGSAVMAKTAMADDVQQVIAEANAAVDEAKAVRDGEKKPERDKRIFKAKAVRGWKIVKKFHKGIILETVGAACVGTGYNMAEKGKHRALKAVGALGAAFASYRANVREDLGEEADLKYFTGRHAVKRTEKIDKKTGEVTHNLEYDDDGLYIKKDPNAFRFWFSEETCPELWSTNFDLRKANLKWVEDTINRQFMLRKHLTLNDMRREYGPLINPSDNDVDIGGIYGRVWKEGADPKVNYINTHYKDDRDFMEGRSEGCWIIFDCDPEPIIGRVGKKFTKVEK